MNAAEEYKPAVEFEKVEVEPTHIRALPESSEVWLIQVPLKEFDPNDFSGRELSIKLRDAGLMGSVENSHGKTYDLVGSEKPETPTFVMLPSASKPLGVQKVARHVCVVSKDVEDSKTGKIMGTSLGVTDSISQGTSRGTDFSLSQGKSMGSSLNHGSQGVSGISFEGNQSTTPHPKKSVKREATDKKQEHSSYVTSQSTEKNSTEVKKKKRKSSHDS
eukprot:TRINITY_DN24873_c0_g1_i2.p1 TRINITY_DN24873_c0_g1~~TRINITY_DN24873_c0_g1_i2.p1  ORF type:complete len:218 (+),score=55.22 TRINITY_DN24873_c0_g1_i2:194-847(+)